jgi:hypothetical protein
MTDESQSELSVGPLEVDVGGYPGLTVVRRIATFTLGSIPNVGEPLFIGFRRGAAESR